MFIASIHASARRAVVAAVCIIAGSASFANTIAITEYMNDTNGPAGPGEWVELFNYGTASVNISGWRLKDDDSVGITLGNITIPAKDFFIVARDKVTFEDMWLGGVASAKVAQMGSTTAFAQSDTGADELVLNDSGGTLRWRLAHGPNESPGSSTYFAIDNFTAINHGTKTSVINRNGIDPQDSTLGYEGSEFTADPLAYSGAGDVGSPLRGNYTGATAPSPQPLTWSLNISGPGTTLHQGVRGIAIADQALNRGDNSDQSAVMPAVEIAAGGALRGVSGGLNADIYNWKTRNNNPRPTTLEFLRYARDSGSEFYITTNIRGLTEPDLTSPTTHRRYYDTSPATLATLAADWVRYTNHIIQNYREGDTITDSRDQAILDSLTWNSAYVNPYGTADDFTTLPAVGEAPIPAITYWEIGNEPLISLANAYSTTNAFTFSGTAGNLTYADFRDRYIQITTAMLAEDPTIKVGPCMVSGRDGANADILALLLQSSAQVDFISYHPYGSMGDYPNSPLWQQVYLGGAYDEQRIFLEEIKDLVALHRPAQVNSMEYVASETNVSDFRTNNTFQEGSMAHALGSVESVFSWARLGLRAAHYWIWITATPTYIADSNRFAVSMAFEKLRDELGDRLLGSFDANDKVRIHVVKDSATGDVAVWAMNFSHLSDQVFQLSLTGGPSAMFARVTKEELEAISGATNLFSANLNPEINGGVPRRDVDWTAAVEVAGADPANLTLLLPAATLTLLKIENLTPTIAVDWSLYQ